jgi:hypothetical protein
VPEEIAVELAPLLDQGLPHTGVLTKVLTGGRTPIPVVQARLFRVDAAVADLVLEHEVPALTAVPRPSASPPVLSPASPPARAGCLPVVVLLVGSMSLAAATIIDALR